MAQVLAVGMFAYEKMCKRMQKVYSYDVALI